MRQFSINDAMSCAAKWINRIRRGGGGEGYEGAACAQRSGLSAGGKRDRHCLVAGHAAEAECIECCFIKAAPAGQGGSGGGGAQGAACTFSPCRNYRNYNER